MNTQNVGWICPRCNAVHAPTVLRCFCTTVTSPTTMTTPIQITPTCTWIVGADPLDYTVMRMGSEGDDDDDPLSMFFSCNPRKK